MRTFCFLALLVVLLPGSMTLAAARSPELAARFGNLVASITIMKKGTGTASPEEVLAAAGRE
jgi:sugar/nucleoside kinase (ribokinase family)